LLRALIGGGLAAVLAAAAAPEELPLRRAAADYREGRLMDALRISSEVLASDPEKRRRQELRLDHHPRTEKKQDAAGAGGN